jgi:hypothetical protein
VSPGWEIDNGQLLSPGAAEHRDLVVAFQGFDAFTYAIPQVVDGT